jgi:uncharacterized protein YcbK (DUF882 family)
MPRLPTYVDLGEAPSARSGRAIAEVDVSGYAKGIRDLGAGLQDSGRTLFAEARRNQSETDDIETARARAAWSTGRVNLESSFRQDDPNYTQWGERYSTESERLRQEAASGIRDPIRRERFLLETQPQVATGSARIQGLVDGRNRDAGIAGLNGTLEQAREAAIKTNDDAERERLIQSGSQAIDNAIQRGFISQQQGQSLRQRWTTDYRTATLNQLPPEERAAALRENRGNVSFAPGVDQRLSEPAQRLLQGLQTTPDLPRVVINSGHRDPERNAAAGGARGSQHIHGNAMDLQTARLSDEDKAKVLAAAIANGARGIGIYPSGNIHIDTRDAPAIWGPNGYRGSPIETFPAWARPHLQRLMETGGSSPPERSALASRPQPQATASRGSAMAAGLPTEVRQQMLVQTEQEIAQAQRQAEVGRRHEAAAIQAAIGDDLASVERSGQGVPTERLSRERIASVMGEEGARAWEVQRSRAKKVHDALNGIESLPEGDIERRLQALQPQPGAEGYVEDTQAYDRARRRADAIREARAKDPALAAERIPSVAEARQQAQYDETPTGRSIRPESAQAIIRARLAAQAQLGIREPHAVTVSEGREIARQLRFIGEDDGAGLERFMGSLRGTYGEFADEVLVSSLQLANVNRDLGVQAVAVLNRLMSATSQQEAQSALQMLSAPIPVPRPSDAEMAAEAFGGSMGWEPQPSRQSAPTAPAAPPATYEAADLRRLFEGRGNPEIVGAFEQKYGRGAASAALTDLMRRLGGSNNDR